MAIKPSMSWWSGFDIRGPLVSVIGRATCGSGDHCHADDVTGAGWRGFIRHLPDIRGGLRLFRSFGQALEPAARANVGKAEADVPASDFVMQICSFPRREGPSSGRKSALGAGEMIQ
jgi:hypothetical protein